MNEGSFGEATTSASYVAPAVTQKVEYGEDQGGLLDWFRRKRMKISEPTLVPDSEAGKDGGGHDFMSHRSRAIAEMVAQASPQQLASDPALQQLVLEDFNTSFSKRLQRDNAPTRQIEMENMRHDEGEMWSFNRVLQSMLPEGYGKSIYQASGGDVIDATSMISTDLQEGGDLEHMARFMGGARDAFRGANFLDSDEEASQALMNNLMLRTIQPAVAGDGLKTMDKGMISFSPKLASEVAEQTANDDLRTTGPFLQSIKNFFKRKR